MFFYILVHYWCEFQFQDIWSLPESNPLRTKFPQQKNCVLKKWWSRYEYCICSSQKVFTFESWILINPNTKPWINSHNPCFVGCFPCLLTQSLNTGVLGKRQGQETEQQLYTTYSCHDLYSFWKDNVKICLFVCFCPICFFPSRPDHWADPRGRYREPPDFQEGLLPESHQDGHRFVHPALDTGHAAFTL